MVKLAFLVGVLAGVAGILCGAHFYPWVDPSTRPLLTSVLPDGGVAERFIIRLPSDRIVVTNNHVSGGLAKSFPGDLAEPALSSDQPLLVEQFKLRDRTGHVIGVAARHWTVTDKGPATAWLLLLPGRGALMLTTAARKHGAMYKALAAVGYKKGQPWVGEVQFDAATGKNSHVAGGGEFAGVHGHYSETWDLTGVDRDGALRGTITLDTTTYMGR